MLINLKIISTFAVFFSKNMQVTPLASVKQHLGDFLQARVAPYEFQQSFSAYQAYLLRALQENPTPHPLKIQLLDLTSLIYARYRLPTQKLNKIHNQLIAESLELTSQKGLQDLARVLTMMLRVNRSKSLAFFKKQKQNVVAQMRSFAPIQTLELLTFLKEAKIDDPVIRETSVELLFDEIPNLNAFELNLLLSSLAYSKKYINRDFLGRVGQRVLALYQSGNLKEKEVPGLLAYISQIEANLHTRAVYVEELDRLYEKVLPDLYSSAEGLYDNLLNRVVSATRRSKFFEESFLAKLTHLALKRTITELTEQDKQGWRSQMSLRTFLNIVHTHAVFNYHQPEFKAYLMEVLKILMLKAEIIGHNAFFKLLWSLCVLFERHQLAALYPLIEQFIVKAQDLPSSQAYNVYYCYLYLRTACPQINAHRDHILKLMEGHFVETKPSQTQMEVYETMLEVGVPCIPEYNLNNLTCDIMIPAWRSLKNVIVEMHGFRHFCRNVKRLTGSNALKEKIIANEMYKYYFITVDEWLIAEDKKQFILDFLEHIDQLEQVSAQTKPLPAARTSTRVRGRPRSFRVASTQSLPQ